jgi:hypothetical protein
MKPMLLTDPDDRRLSWLVDADSAATRYEPTSGHRLIHYGCAVNVQDLAPGRFRFNPSAGGFIPGFELDSEAEPPTAETASLLALGFVFPAPCVFAPRGRWQADKEHRQTFDGPSGCVRGIYRPAAVALLRLARARSNITACDITEGFTFRDARIEAPRGMPPDEVFLPWCEWKFITAWTWSEWRREEIHTGRKLPLAARWERLARIGYPNGLKAFERMHGELFPKRRGKPTN